MTTTYPSKRSVIVDVPEVKDFGCKFVYNFFTRDEDYNDSGTTPPDFIENRKAAGFDQQFIDSANFNRFTPRYVQFSWRANPAGNRPDLIQSIDIQGNLDKIHDEQTFINRDYTDVYFSDSGLDGKLQFFIKRALDEAAKQQNPGKARSPIDLAVFLNSNTDSDVKPDFLSEYFASYKSAGFQFLDETKKQEFEKNISMRLSRGKLRTQINNKFIYDLLNTAAQSPISVFDDEGYLETFQDKQEKNRSEQPSYIFDAKDYDFEIVNMLDYKVIPEDMSAAFNPVVQIVGYVIEKIEYTDQGPVVKDSVVVENPNSSTTVDLKVRYGGRYGYRIKSIAYMETMCVDLDPESNDIVVASFLVSSQPSEEIRFDCIETTPPPSPADFNIKWDYVRGAPLVFWSFPVNTQRDIKHFQIFRRMTVDEPFELIRQYSFNDSETPRPINELPDPLLIEDTTNNIKTSFLDTEFTKDSRYIYAVCSVDAHGYTSNYSQQFLCYFDRYQNKMHKELVSVSGAPKPYPNFFLRRDTFVDSIRISGRHKLKVVFNPEYLAVKDRLGNDLGFLKTDSQDFYALQLINVDLQDDQVLKINVSDKRPSKKKL